MNPWKFYLALRAGLGFGRLLLEDMGDHVRFEWRAERGGDYVEWFVCAREIACHRDELPAIVAVEMRETFRAAKKQKAAP